MLRIQQNTIYTNVRRPADEKSEGILQEGLYVYCIIGTGEARNFGCIPMAKYVVNKETMVSHEKVIEAVMKGHIPRSRAGRPDAPADGAENLPGG